MSDWYLNHHSHALIGITHLEVVRETPKLLHVVSGVWTEYSKIISD